MSYASKRAARARSKTTMGSAFYGPWKAPFRYDDAGCLIVDAGGHRVLDLRGWGYLTGQGCGALGMTQEAAIAIQDRVGKRVVELLNEDFADQQPEASPSKAAIGCEPVYGTLTFPDGSSVTFDGASPEEVNAVVAARRCKQNKEAQGPLRSPGA